MNVYLKDCIGAVKSIDVDKLAATPLGEEIGWESGSESDFHILGQLPVNKVLQWVGIKGPRWQSSDQVGRLQIELKFIGRCVEISPAIRELVPSFIGLVSVENSDIIALITEDASRGDSIEVRSAQASREARELIDRAFRDFGEGYRLGSAELNRTTSFDVAGQERLLDFTPEPVIYAIAPDTYKTLHSEIMDAIPDLTIELPADSVLGQDLRAQYGNLPKSLFE